MRADNHLGRLVHARAVGRQIGVGGSGVVEAVRTAGAELLKLPWCLEDTVPG